MLKKHSTRLLFTRAELLEYAGKSPLGEERRKKELTVYVLTKVYDSSRSFPMGTYGEPHVAVRYGIAVFEYVRILTI